MYDRYPDPAPLAGRNACPPTRFIFNHTLKREQRTSGFLIRRTLKREQRANVIPTRNKLKRE